MLRKKDRGAAVVVTGASSGIGRATALHLADKGFDVFAGVRKKSDADSLDAMDQLIADSDGAGSPPEKVAKKVAHALTALRPKPRYLVGGDARGALAAKTVLPARSFDRMRTRLMKLPKRKSALK